VSGLAFASSARKGPGASAPGPFARSLALGTVAIVLSGLLAACGEETKAEKSSNKPGTKVVSAGLPDPAGPLANGRWPAGSVKAGSLLHDDGRTLWAVGLEGGRRALWRHPRASVHRIVASPNGRQLAISVLVTPPPRSTRSPSGYLYLLDADGRVKTIDVLRNHGYATSPIFLRAPTENQGKVRLHWVRMWEDIDGNTGRPLRKVMLLDQGRRKRVATAFRYGEAANAITGYAGSPLFAATLYRRDNLPTRLEIVRSSDYAFLKSTSLTFWTQFTRIADTDLFTGPAWISPREYVVPVAHRSYPNQFTLRLYRVTCEYWGSHVVYRGSEIDWGFAETPWPLLPGGRNRVLALGAADVAAVADEKAQTARWLAIDVRSGAISQTGAVWRPGGWWTYVQPGSRIGAPKTTAEAACDKYEWQYP